ncbi:hypothetical protein [Vulcanisaeta sp. EB80]|uniref:hypothetical protein n=1 Tax=Vulcanisaeta sp. EB80 TaxID=1650660 RepID=UPI001180A33E|nr:hypothetical protein [Vulcanisaeta sp. EB80]
MRVLTTSLLIATIIAVITAFALSLTHGTKPVETNLDAPMPTGTRLDTTIYVVDPQSSIQELTSAGIPQSLIKPISLSQLLNLPNNSVVMIDWSVVGSYVDANIGGNVTLNLASPVVGLLEGLFAKGDLVLVNVSRSEALVAELLLSYAMARGANVVFYGLNGARFYVVPMLEMPVNSNYTLVGATAIETPYGVAVLVGPVSLEGLPNLLRNWLVPIEAAKGEIKLPTTNQDPSYQNMDPCYVVYMNDFSSSQSSSGIYTSGDYILLWGMQALVSQGAPYSYDYGIEAVQDNYGDTFYYDSCILMLNSVLGSTANGEGVIGAELMGDVAYSMSPGGIPVFSMLGDFDMYGSSEALGKPVLFNEAYKYNAYIADGYGAYEPTPMLSMPAQGVYELVRVSTTYYYNGAGYYAYNLTWSFSYIYPLWLFGFPPQPGVFINGFKVGPGGSAGIFLKNYSPGGTYWFYLPFRVGITTGLQLGFIDIPCWRVWTNEVWVVGLVSSLNNTISINATYYKPQGVPGSLVTGYYVNPICNVWVTSPPMFKYG